jgi:hypothetical protein
MGKAFQKGSLLSGGYFHSPLQPLVGPFHPPPDAFIHHLQSGRSGWESNQNIPRKRKR